MPHSDTLDCIPSAPATSSTHIHLHTHIELHCYFCVAMLLAIGVDLGSMMPSTRTGVVGGGVASVEGESVSDAEVEAMMRGLVKS
jgi:hypothetical protein